MTRHRACQRRQIVGPVRRSLEIHELTPSGEYHRAAEFRCGSARNVPGCAGLALSMDALWAKVDELGE
jgi:hypothetical protein